MICFPYAKINLGLQVKNKREDGFHNIESVLVPIPFYDVLELKPAKKFSLKTYGLPLGINSANNILFTTWKALAGEFRIPPLEIHLLKNIPVQSGLGGGSSNAAFLIKAVNDLFKLELGTKQLQLLALSIGSDCPFFIENQTAFIEGRGEKLKQLSLSIKGLQLVLLNPNFGVSTQQAYALIKPKVSNSLLENVSQPIETWRDELKNDFEEPVFKKHPQLKRLKDGLYKSGAVYASLSGSGSTIFGLFENQPELSSSLKRHVLWSAML